MTDSRGLFIEGKIISAVKRLLSERVNEILGGYDFALPEIEFGNYTGANVIVPVVSLNLCEKAEKERLILLDAYSLTICFTLPETPESELHCYACAAAVEKALRENMTLDGIVDRIVLTAKKYVPPKKPLCGEDWELVLSFRITVERFK